MFSHLLGARSTFAIVAFIVGFNANATMIPDYYTAVRAQIDSEDCDGVDCVDVISVVYGDTFAETGTAPLAYAKARAGYGDQGGYAIATDQPEYIGAYAESIWVDAFTITGGTGTGNLAISVLVNGTQEGDGANSLFHLYVSDSPIACDFDGLFDPEDDFIVCTGEQVVVSNEGISGSQLFSGQVSFTYGQTFYIASYFGAEVLGDGTSDFFGSAHFGATAPDGSGIVGESGTAYALAAQVPEPASLALIGLGLVSLGVTRRRKI